MRIINLTSTRTGICPQEQCHSWIVQASMDMLLGSRFGADHEVARRAALALRLHSVPAISSKPLPSQRR